MLAAAELDGIVVSNTVCSIAKQAGLLPANVTVLDTSHLLGEAMALSHSGIWTALRLSPPGNRPNQI